MKLLHVSRIGIGQCSDEIDEKNAKCVNLKSNAKQLNAKRMIKSKTDRRSIHNAKEHLNPLKAAWKTEKIVDHIQSIKKKMDELNVQSDKAERESDFDLVAKLKYGDLKEQEQQIKRC